jgi:hypothetical protein
MSQCSKVRAQVFLHMDKSCLICEERAIHMESACVLRQEFSPPNDWSSIFHQQRRILDDIFPIHRHVRDICGGKQTHGQAMCSVSVLSAHVTIEI